MPDSACKPLIVGMNNPLSATPEHALYPWPRGCAGHRLYEMRAAAGGVLARLWTGDD